MQHQATKPLPPYGAILEAYRKEAIRLEFPVYIFIGLNAFQEAKFNKQAGIMASCIPYGNSIDMYRWPIEGQRIILCDSGGVTEATCRYAAAQLLKAGASQVTLYSENFPLDIINQGKDHGQ